MAAKYPELESNHVKVVEQSLPPESHKNLKSLAEKVTEELTCAICFCRYDQPKVLPCLHLYCEKCLETMVSKIKNKSQAEITCPQCQEKHCLPMEGVHGFKTYFTINNLLELLRVHEATGDQSDGLVLLCESGLDDSNQPAVARCIPCGHYLCDHCLSIHQRQKITKYHTVRTLEEIKLADKAQGIQSLMEDKRCENHKGEILKLFCKTCKKVICRDCALVGCRAHDYVFVRDILSATQNNLKSLVVAVQAKEKECQTQQKHLENVTATNAQTLKSCEKTVNEHCQDLIAAIETRQAALISELHSVHEREYKQIAVESDSLSMALVRLSNGIRFTEQLLENGDDVEVMTISTQATETLKGLKSIVLDKEWIKPTSLRVSFTAKLMRMVECHGAIHTTSAPVSETHDIVPVPESGCGHRTVAPVSKTDTVPDPTDCGHRTGAPVSEKCVPVPMGKDSDNNIVIRSVPTKADVDKEIKLEVQILDNVPEDSLSLYDVKVMNNDKEINVDIQDYGNNTWLVSCTPSEAGECTVSVQFNHIEIKHCTFKVMDVDQGLDANLPDDDLDLHEDSWIPVVVSIIVLYLLCILNCYRDDYQTLFEE